MKRISPLKVFHILLLALFVLGPAEVHPAPRGIVINESNEFSFVHVPGRYKGKALACKIQGKKLVAGFKERHLNGKTKFISYSALRKVSSKQEAAGIRKASTKTRLRCALFLSRVPVSPTPDAESPNTNSTPTPISRGTNTPTPDPNSTFTPTPTNSPNPQWTSTPTFSPTPSATATPTLSITPIRINSGGNNYTDSGGKLWLTDNGSPWLSGGTSTYQTADPIANTADDPLYQTERYTSQDFFSYTIPVQNRKYDVKLHFAEIAFTSAGARKFDVAIEDVKYLDDFDIFAQAGGSKVALIVPITNIEVTDGSLHIEFTPSYTAGGQRIDNPKISAIEVAPSQSGDPFLHVVMDGPAYRVDYDGNGSVAYPLDGSTSHTHEPGRSIVEWEWRKGANIIGTSPTISPVLPLGQNAISLTIRDDGDPQRTLADSKIFSVYPIYSVGGLLAKFYQSANPVGIIDNLPSVPNFIQTLESTRVSERGGKVESSPFGGNVVVQLLGELDISSAGTYTFTISGSAAYRLYVDGQLVSAPRSLSVGRHELQVRYAITNLNSVPAYVSMAKAGSGSYEIPKDRLYHDETGLLPFINSMKQSGSEQGGETIQISGLGFFPSAQTKVRWGGMLLTPFSIQPEKLLVISPPGTGSVQVKVETPAGSSNEKTFTYNSGEVPIEFHPAELIDSVPGVTQIAWGPDGRLYAATLDGVIVALTLDEHFHVLGTQTISAISYLSNPSILGIAFDPHDPPTPVKIYVSHSALFQNGGSCYSGFSPYSGQVSRLTGPLFSNVEPIITGLPVSNHDHAVNGLQFDDYGSLLISQGGNTNAGVHNCGENCCNMGNVPESPLSGAVLIAPLKSSEFNGDLSYKETDSGNTNNDQTFGHIVDLAPGKSVKVFAPGLRNPFDLVWTTRGLVYGTDNGPNFGFGNASTGANTQGPDPQTDDEILLLLQDHFYGHPNRNRGRKDPRQNIYRNSETASPIRGIYTGPLGLNPPSTNGIDEYRGTAFQGAMRGDLLIQRYGGGGTTELLRAGLTPDGRFIEPEEFEVIESQSSGLDVISAPGGAIIVSDIYSSDIRVLKPDDSGAGSMQGYDIFPWRGKAGTKFAIGGVGFGGSTSVTIGGVSAQITEVSSQRIFGIVPTRANPTSDLLDVAINSNGLQYTITNAFRYLLDNGQGSGTWKSDLLAPTALGEIAAGIVNGVLYAVGAGSTQTLGFDFSDGTWTNALAVRPYPGDHSGAEVIGSKLYLFGGLGGNSGNKVQIYNAENNSWSLGAQIPLGSGAASTALIDGKVYYAGGTDGSSTRENAYKYDVTLNSWSAISPMPPGYGRHHAASGTDGARFFIFGGRDGGNTVSNGYAHVLIYNPSTNLWSVNSDGGQNVPPLPQARGGMGKAVFFNGEFYVIGGEVPSQVFKRVDVYNPTTRTWRRDADLITGRHGSFPLAWNGKIFVPLGGTAVGGTQSKLNEYLYR